MLQEDQALAVKGLSNFLKNDHLTVAVSGPAGTGKTYMLNEFCKINKIKPVIVAPTHTAKGVMSSAMGYSAITLAQLLGLRPDVTVENYDPLDPVFGKINPHLFEKNQIYIIDESSMISKDLEIEIYKYCESYSCKVIYVGDPFQCKPVKGQINTIFLQKPLHDVFYLTIIKRTDKLDIQKYCNQVRDGFGTLPIESENIRIIKKEDYLFDDTIILAYTNRAVNEWNDAYLAFYNRNLFDIGSRFMFNVNIKNKIYNGTVVTLTEVVKSSRFLEVTFKNKNMSYKFNIILDLQAYSKHHDELVERAPLIKNGWLKYYQFREKNLIVSEYGKHKPDIRLAHSITIHKSQGQTFDNVAVDFYNITGDDFFNILYTAVSRTKNRLTLLI